MYDFGNFHFHFSSTLEGMGKENADQMGYLDTLFIQIYDEDLIGKPEFMGEVQLTASQVKILQGKSPFVILVLEIGLTKTHNPKTVEESVELSEDLKKRKLGTITITLSFEEAR